MKITRKAIQFMTDYLRNEEPGKYVNNSEISRRVEINPTVSGRYVLYDGKCVDSVTDNETIAIMFVLGIDFVADECDPDCGSDMD